MQDLLKVILFTIVFLNLWIPNSFAEGRARLFTSDATTTNSMSPSTDDDHRKEQAPTHHPPHPVASMAAPISTPPQDHHKNDHDSSDQPAKKHDTVTYYKDHGRDQSKDKKEEHHSKDRNHNQDQDKKEKQHHEDREKEVVYYNYVSYEPYIGQILPMLPWDSETIVVNGHTYYTSNGVYYMDNEQGYRVVPQPITVDNVMDSDNTDDSFTVNIPDRNGGYVPVVIRRSGTGSGFVGPQNEYYEDFPTVSQLQQSYL